MRTKIALSIAAAAMLASGVAYAQSGSHRGPHHGMPMGDMTRADVEARTAKMFGRMDANDDGVLNQDDRAARQQARFDRIDADSNGSISFDEFSAKRERRHEARGEGQQGRHHRMGGRRMGGRGHGMMAKKADTDGDGSVSQAEFTAAALAHFDRADADGNGTVTADERKAAHQKMRAMHKAATAG